MSHIFDAFSISTLGSNTTDVISALGPLVELLVGILLAFSVIEYIVGIFHKEKEPENKNDEII